MLRLGQANGPTACSQSSTYQLGEHFLQLLQVHTDQVLSLGLSHTADGRFWGGGALGDCEGHSPVGSWGWGS